MKKLFGLMVLTLFILTGCRSGDQVYHGTNYELGDTPADLCYIDGEPQIYGVTLEDNFVYLVYLSTDDRIVARQYSDDILLNNEMRGSYYWGNANCPNSEE